MSQGETTTASHAQRRKSRSVLLLDGSLNTSLIVREVAQDIEATAKYSAEDNMKKRVVHTCKGYDEFKDFVSCSQLKPVATSDMRQLFQSQGGQNRVPNRAFTHGSRKSCDDRPNVGVDCRSLLSDLSKLDISVHDQNNDFYVLNRKQKATVKNKKKERNAKKAKIDQNHKPQTSGEIEKEWRKYCTSVENTLAYIMAPECHHENLDSHLKTFFINDTKTDSDLHHQNETIYIPSQNLRIVPEDIPNTIFKVEIDATILGSILDALDHFISVHVSKTPNANLNNKLEKSDNHPTDDSTISTLKTQTSFIFRWMYALTQCGRFSLNISLVDRNQLNEAQRILEFLELNYVHIHHPNLKTGISVKDQRSARSSDDLELNHNDLCTIMEKIQHSFLT